MGKINNVRLPDAANSATIAPGQFNQLIRSLEQIIQQLNSTYGSVTDQNQAAIGTWFGAAGASAGFAGGVRGFQLSNGISLPHAMFMSDQDQTNASITGENILTFNQTPISNGVYIEDGTKVKVPCPGQYLITFRLQATNRGNTAAEFEVWAKANGTNFPMSNTRFDIPVRKSSTIWAHTVPTVTGIFSVADPANDYLQIAWWSDSLDVYLEQYPVNTNPTRPEIASVIMTVNFISAV
jgi:hypothetical protein